MRTPLESIGGFPIPETNPAIALGSDHAGYSIKETLRQFLENAGYPVDDLGTRSEESMDYLDYREAVWRSRCRALGRLWHRRLWDGVGISIAANQVHGVRAAVAHNVDTARLVREHNDANVLTLGGRVVNGPLGIEMVQIFLKTEFLGGRHPRRVEKISRIETKKQR